MLHHRLLVPIAVVPFAVGAVLSGTASAATTAPATNSLSLGAAEVAGPDAAAAAVGVGINGGRWSRSSVSTHLTPSAQTCTARTAGLVIYNNTKVAQGIKSGGRLVIKLPAGYKVPLCGRNAPGTLTLVLARSGDRLPVHFS